MRVTFVLPSIGITGGIRAVFECANRLKDRGHEVHIVYPLIFYKYSPRFSLRTLAIQVLETLNNIKRRNKVDWFDVRAKLIRIPTLSPKFIGLFENKIPGGDFIIATAWETAYPLLELSEKKGDKLYFVQHYEIWDLWNSNACWEEAERIEEDKNRLCLAMAEVVPEDSFMHKTKSIVDRTYKLPLKKITTSSWLKELIETKFKERVLGIIPIGNNFDTFHAENIKETSTDRKKRILMSYRGLKWKGDHDGLKALQTVKKRFPDIEIIAYGPRKDGSVPDWIKFYERVSDAELRRLYASSDIFVFPSWVEGYGSPPMEAMACGAACVTTNVGAVPDYTIPGKTAIVVPPRNPEKLAEAIITLLEDDEKRNHIAKAGYEYIQQFTWSQTVGKLEEILQQLLQGKRFFYKEGEGENICKLQS